MKIFNRFLPFILSAKAIPRLLLLSSIIICWLGGAFSAYANNDGRFKVKLPYDKKLLPTGYSEQNINTYYYDDQAKQWKIVERVAVDTGQQEIVSQTDHFSDYVNAIRTCQMESPYYLCWAHSEEYIVEGNSSVNPSGYVLAEGGATVKHILALYNPNKQDGANNHRLALHSASSNLVSVDKSITILY